MQNGHLSQCFFSHFLFVCHSNCIINNVDDGICPMRELILKSLARGCSTQNGQFLSCFFSHFFCCLFAFGINPTHPKKKKLKKSPIVVPFWHTKKTAKIGPKLGSIPSFNPSFAQKTALRAPCDIVLVNKNNCFEQCCATACQHQVSVTMLHVFLPSSLCFLSSVASHCGTMPLMGTSRNRNHCHSCKVCWNQTTKNATFEVTVVKVKSSLLPFCKQSSECKDHLHLWEQWLTLTWSVNWTDVHVVSPSKNQFFFDKQWGTKKTKNLESVSHVFTSFYKKIDSIVIICNFRSMIDNENQLNWFDWTNPLSKINLFFNKPWQTNKKSSNLSFT